MKKGFCLLMVSLMVLIVGFGVTAKNLNPEGQITIVGSNVETLNPLLSESSYETTVLNGVFSQLIRLTDSADLIPDLAVEVPTVENGGISEDGMVFTFHLRKDVKWHDGTPLTAEDVLFTWDIIMNDDVAVVSRDGFDQIERIEIPDPYTVIMYKTEPTANWLLTWAGTGGAIVPKHLWENAAPSEFSKAHELSRQPIGSGPFKFAEWVPGSYIILEANKDYYGDGPYLAKIIYKEVESNLTQITMLKTGEADISMNLEGSQLEQVKAIDRLKTTLDPASIYVHMTFNLENPIFQDKLTRQALSYALPRELIVEKILKGVGIPAATSTSPVLWAYDKNITPYPFDMEKAKELLTKAGWRDMDGDGILENGDLKFEFELATNAGRQIRERIAQIAQQYWKQLGIKVNLSFQESTTLYGDTLENRKFDMIMFGWVTGSDPDEFTMYHSSQIPSESNGLTGQNYGSYINPEIDELLEDGRAMMNNEDRIPLYHKVQSIVYDEIPMLYVYFYVEINVAPKNLLNWRPAPFTNAKTWNINEWKFAN